MASAQYDARTEGNPGSAAAAGTRLGEKTSSMMMGQHGTSSSVPAGSMEPAGTTKPSQITCSEMCLQYLLISTVQHYRQMKRAGVKRSKEVAVEKEMTIGIDTGTVVDGALDSIGYHLGQNLAERLTAGNKTPIIESLDVMKWVCKDLWSELFGKTVDNLRTNHKGTFVLRDTQFRWTMRISQNLIEGGEKLSGNALASDFLLIPAAIIRGAVQSFGYEATVTADATALPQCDFTVLIEYDQRNS